MNDLNPLQLFILQMAADGIGADELRTAALRAFPDVGALQYRTTLFGLQAIDRLVGQEEDGQWHFWSIDTSAPDYPPPEYSAAFAEQIIAASCEPFIEIDIDALLAEMLAEAHKAQVSDSDRSRGDTGL